MRISHVARPAALSCRGPVGFWGVALAMWIASSAQAVPTYFFGDPVVDRAAFQTAASGALFVESFEDPSTPGGTQISFPGSGPQSFVLDAGAHVSISTFARGVSDGVRSLGTVEDVSFLTFTFAVPVRAFGIDVNDLNFADMSFSDDLGNAIPNVLLGDDCGPSGGTDCENLQFFGVTNPEPFRVVHLAFTRPSATGNLYLDHLEFRTVPEPSTLLLVMGGLVGLAARAR